MPCQAPSTACASQSNLVNFFLRAHYNVDTLTKPCKQLWSPAQASEAYAEQQGKTTTIPAMGFACNKVTAGSPDFQEVVFLHARNSSSNSVRLPPPLADFCAMSIVWGTSPICRAQGESGCLQINTTAPCGKIQPTSSIAPGPPTPAPTWSPTSSSQLIAECGVPLPPSISDWAVGTCGNRISSDSRVFGPPTWRTLHIFAEHYPENPLPHVQRSCVNFINALPFLLPCPYSGNSFAQVSWRLRPRAARITTDFQDTHPTEPISTHLTLRFPTTRTCTHKFINKNNQYAGTFNTQCMANATYDMPCTSLEMACANQPALVSFFLRAHHSVVRTSNDPRHLAREQERKGGKEGNSCGGYKRVKKLEVLTTRAHITLPPKRTSTHSHASLCGAASNRPRHLRAEPTSAPRASSTASTAYVETSTIHTASTSRRSYPVATLCPTHNNHEIKTPCGQHGAVHSMSGQSLYTNIYVRIGGASRWDGFWGGGE